MGIRGLTTYIAQNARKFHENYELHDTYLVIDGNNIACNLYKHCKTNDCFGGDYDKYAATVYKFFDLLKECNVTPLIVFDGGYENKKIKTVYRRIRDRIKSARQLNAITEGQVTVFPLFMRELFKDIALKLKLKAIRCDFESDYDSACIAKALNCPLLSYDSDFYVFDVLYIPFLTMVLKAVKNSKKQKYIPCDIFRIEKFLKTFNASSKKNMPLLAILLGNDYIKKSYFSNFHKQMTRKTHSDLSTKVALVLNWLKAETFESAVEKILGRLKTKRRRMAARQIRQITRGYICEESKVMKYLDLNVNIQSEGEDIEDIDTLLERALIIEDCEDNEGLEDSEGGEFDDLIEGQDLNECQSLIEDFDDQNDITSHGEIEDQEIYDGQDEVDEESEDDGCPNEEVIEEIFNYKNVPQWFLDNFRRCRYPPFFMDILYRNIYYTSPQIERYNNDCTHIISFDILSAIHKILTSNSCKRQFRCVMRKHMSIKHYAIPKIDVDLPVLSDLENGNGELYIPNFLNVLKIDLDFLQTLKKFPSDWRLYLLSLKYWFENSKPTISTSHIYSIILCAIVVKHCDPLVGFYRSTKKFFSKFQNKIEDLGSKSVQVKKDICNSVEESLKNINYNDALLCLKELIGYFQMDYKMKEISKLYDISIIDSFAQFQSVLLHVKYLNALLNCPFEDVIISEFYDGTFVYNMYTNLTKRTDIITYMATLLRSSQTVLNSFQIIVENLNNVVIVSSSTCKRKRRNRRKKKKSDSVIVLIEEGECKNSEESSESDDVYDENNRFSLLRKNI